MRSLALRFAVIPALGSHSLARLRLPAPSSSFSAPTLLSLFLLPPPPSVLFFVSREKIASLHALAAVCGAERPPATRLLPSPGEARLEAVFGPLAGAGGLAAAVWVAGMQARPASVPWRKHCGANPSSRRSAEIWVLFSRRLLTPLSPSSRRRAESLLHPRGTPHRALPPASGDRQPVRRAFPSFWVFSLWPSLSRLLLFFILLLNSRPSRFLSAAHGLRPPWRPTLRSSPPCAMPPGRRPRGGAQCDARGMHDRGAGRG